MDVCWARHSQSLHRLWNEPAACDTLEEARIRLFSSPGCVAALQDYLQEPVYQWLGENASKFEVQPWYTEAWIRKLPESFAEAMTAAPGEPAQIVGRRAEEHDRSEGFPARDM